MRWEGIPEYAEPAKAERRTWVGRGPEGRVNQADRPETDESIRKRLPSYLS
jgi:hypothetical protein